MLTISLKFEISIASGNDFLPNTQQVIIWTISYPINWCIYTTLGLGVLTQKLHPFLPIPYKNDIMVQNQTGIGPVWANTSLVLAHYWANISLILSHYIMLTRIVIQRLQHYSGWPLSWCTVSNLLGYSPFPASIPKVLAFYNPIKRAIVGQGIVFTIL